MKELEAIEQLKLIRDNIEQPTAEYTKIGLSITALTYGIEAIEKQMKIKEILSTPTLFAEKFDRICELEKELL